MTSFSIRTLFSTATVAPRVCRVCVAFLVVLASALCAHAQIISNFPPTNDTGTSAGLTTARVKILRFAMPAGSSYTLTSVDMRLNCAATTVVPDASIWSDVSDGLGVQLVALTGPAITTTGLQTYTVTPASSFTLQPSTKYWLVVRAAASSVGTLDFRGSSPNITPTGIATHDASRFGTGGVTGTFATSATINTYAVFGIISNPNAMGACCTAAAACTVDSPVNCAAAGSVFLGDGTNCSPNNCTHRGACCSTTTNACSISNNGAAGCTAGTSYQGDGTTCSPNICPVVACCNTTTGVCTTAAPGACASGTTQNAATSCTTNPCPQGACCNAATGVCSVTAPAGCLSGSTYQGDGTGCTVNPCPQPPPPANDLCSTAQALSLNVAIQGSNAQATGDGTEGPGGTCYTTAPDHFSKSVWFSFTAPATTNYLVSACGSTFDTVMSVFSASAAPACDNLVQIGCDDDTCIGGTDNPLPGPGNSALASVVASVPMTAGQTYYVRLAVWTVGGTGGAYGMVVQYVAGTTVGSCCVSTACTLTDAANCTGTFTSGGTCTPNPCGAPAGVCCRGATCNTTVDQASCTGSGAAGANFATLGSTCNSGAVSNAPCCFADYNKVNGISVQDIFDFLGDWFAGNTYANTGGNGTPATLSVQNIFDFLSNWFAGGC